MRQSASSPTETSPAIHSRGCARARWPRSTRVARTAMGARSRAFPAVERMRAPNRSKPAWRTCSRATLPSTPRCTRCRTRRETRGAGSGARPGRCRRGSGESASETDLKSQRSPELVVKPALDAATDGSPGTKGQIFGEAGAHPFVEVAEVELVFRDGFEAANLPPLVA